MRYVCRSPRAWFTFGFIASVALLLPSSTEGGGSHGGGGGGHGHAIQMGGHPANHPTNIIYNPGITLGYGVGGFYAFSSPLAVIGPGGFFPFFAPVFAPQPFPVAMPPMAQGGLMLPMPPPALLGPNLNPNPPRARRASPARSKELVEIGDRSFRGNNIHRAEEKYQLAAKADPTSPAPHIHLAQVSVARGDYAAAADRIRDAVTVAPDGAWLLNAPDIQAVFAEPADFAKQLARIESHLQANPNDRDAWFVLGAEWYLSGRSRQASDAFQRLTDRRPDEALAAFIDASKPRQPAAAN